MNWSWKPSGRHEASSFLVLSLLLMILVSAYTLFSYRASLELLIDERRGEASDWARAFASRIGPRGDLPRSQDLREWMPEAFAVSIFDDRGRLLVTSRMGEGLELTTAGSSFSPQTLVGTARLVRGGRDHLVQVDLWSPTLKSRWASLKVLLPLVLGVDVGVLILLLLYTRRLLQPLDRILDRARALGKDPDSDGELAFLIRTFDSALEQLARPGDVELRALEKALGSSLESGVLLCRADGEVLALNPVGVAILGVVDNPAGLSIQKILGAYPELVDRLKPAFEEQRTVQREECKIQTPGGEKILGLTAHPLKKGGGEISGFLVLFADLTEIQRRLADEKLDEDLRQLGELTAGIAHEMRNGLATVKGYLTLIRKGGNRDSIDDYVEEIQAETETLHRTLEDFLTFARPGASRTEEVDLQQLLHRAAADPALAGARIRVEVDLGSDEGLLRGDRMLLAKALANLLINADQAQQASQCEDPILLRLFSREESYVVQVLDKGPGPAPELAEKVFDPFVTGRPGGVGLGLALTRRIALLHGGSVELCHRENGGACAELQLPAGNSVT